MTAAAASLTTKAIASAHANSGNLSKVLEDLTSKETMTQLVHTVAVSGLTAGVSRGLGIETNVLEQELADRIQQEAVRSVSDIAVSAALGEGDLSGVVERALRGGIANVVTGSLAKETGALFKDEIINEPVQKALHGTIASIGGVIEGTDPSARAVGAIAGEFVGERVRDHLLEGRSIESLSGEEYEALSDRVTAIGQLAAVGTAALLGKDPFAAMHAAEVAVRNNALFILPEQSLRILDYTDAEISAIKEDGQKQEAIKKAIKLRKELESFQEGSSSREKLQKLSHLLQQGENLSKEYPITTKVLKGTLVVMQETVRVLYYGEAMASGATAGLVVGPWGAAAGALLGCGAAYSMEGMAEQSFARLYGSSIERIARWAESQGATSQERQEFRESIYKLGQIGGDALSIAGFKAGIRGVRGIRGPLTSTAGDLLNSRLTPEAYRAIAALETEASLGHTSLIEGLDLATQQVSSLNTKGGKGIRQDAIPLGSNLEYLGPGRVRFEGVEFRAVRDLSHLSERDLKRMLEDGVNPKSMEGVRLDGHHYNQQYHREPNAFIVEIPEPNHCISNPIQHPLGNSGGLTDPQRADWNRLRKAFNKERAKTEILRRGNND